MYALAGRDRRNRAEMNDNSSIPEEKVEAIDYVIKHFDVLKYTKPRGYLGITSAKEKGPVSPSE